MSVYAATMGKPLAAPAFAGATRFVEAKSGYFASASHRPSVASAIRDSAVLRLAELF